MTTSSVSFSERLTLAVLRPPWHPWHRPCAAGSPACEEPGWGLGGRCELHGGLSVPLGARPLVIFSELRADWEGPEALYQGPARVYVAPTAVFNAVTDADAWPERLAPGQSRRHGRRWGARQPGCLEPARGAWPQIVSGRIARQLCRQPGVVSRILASFEFVDGWWLRELLTRNLTAEDAATIAARFELRFSEGSMSPEQIKELTRLGRAERARFEQLGVCSWT